LLKLKPIDLLAVMVSQSPC